MTPRRRRGVALLAASVLLALVGTASLSSYVAEVDSRVGPLTSVHRLRRDVAALQPLTAEDLEVVRVPARWAPLRAVPGAAATSGRVTAGPLAAGTYLTDDVLAPRPELVPGQREIAILIDAETGVAGKVAAGSRVDIVATFTDDATGTSRSEVIVADALVLAIGDLRSDEDEEDGLASGRVVPVTFALSVRESLTLTYAESFATRVRLALVAPTDDRPVPVDERTYTLPTGTEPAEATAPTEAGG